MEVKPQKRSLIESLRQQGVTLGIIIFLTITFIGTFVAISLFLQSHGKLKIEELEGNPEVNNPVAKKTAEEKQLWPITIQQQPVDQTAIMTTTIPCQPANFDPKTAQISKITRADKLPAIVSTTKVGETLFTFNKNGWDEENTSIFDLVQPYSLSYYVFHECANTPNTSFSYVLDISKAGKRNTISRSALFTNVLNFKVLQDQKYIYIEHEIVDTAKQTQQVEAFIYDVTTGQKKMFNANLDCVNGQVKVAADRFLLIGQTRNNAGVKQTPICVVSNTGNILVYATVDGRLVDNNTVQKIIELDTKNPNMIVVYDETPFFNPANNVVCNVFIQSAQEKKAFVVRDTEAKSSSFGCLDMEFRLEGKAISDQKLYYRKPLAKTGPIITVDWQQAEILNIQ